jgi:small nuclear ribonucleoprotein (snRNP)-like protein
MSETADFAPAEFLNRPVVVDVVSQFVFAGNLVGGDHRYLILADADVHDLRDSKTNRDEYVLALRRLGIRPNRSRVFVNRDQIVSLSLLADVVE